MFDSFETSLWSGFCSLLLVEKYYRFTKFKSLLRIFMDEDEVLEDSSQGPAREETNEVQSEFEAEQGVEE